MEIWRDAEGQRRRGRDGPARLECKLAKEQHAILQRRLDKRHLLRIDPCSSIRSGDGTAAHDDGCMLGKGERREKKEKKEGEMMERF